MVLREIWDKFPEFIFWKFIPNFTKLSMWFPG